MATAAPLSLQHFRRDGYAVIDRLVDDRGVAELRTAYDKLLSGEIDCSPTDHRLGLVTRQIMQPFLYHPVFADNDALRNGFEIARTLLDVDKPQPVFQMLIFAAPRLSFTPPYEIARTPPEPHP